MPLSFLEILVVSMYPDNPEKLFITSIKKSQDMLFFSQ